MKHDDVFKRITVGIRIWTMSENSTAVATTLGDGSKCEVVGPIASSKEEMGN